MPSTPCEVTLELARSENTESPFSFRFAPQDYLLRLEDGRYRRASFPWDAKVLTDLAELERPQPDPEAVQRLGDALRAFLTPLDWGVYEKRIEQALRAGQAVHLTLRFAAAELYSLPWELLTLESSGQHLGELAGCTLRYEWPGTQDEATARAPAAPGGRLLFAWSSAGGPLPVASHLRALRSACEAAGRPFDAARDVVENVSVQALSQALGAPSAQPVSVLHLLCHGTRMSADTAGLLLNASQDGQPPDFVDAGRLRQALAPYAGTLKLVVLCACQSGDAAKPGNHLGSVAQALHRAGIPAVVASRLPMTAKASILVAEALYSELTQGSSSVDRALSKARTRLRQEMPGLDWASLQLYASPEGGSSIPFTRDASQKQEPPPPRPTRRLWWAGAGVLAFAAVAAVAVAIQKKPTPTPAQPPKQTPAPTPDPKIVAMLSAVDDLRRTDPTLALLVLREVPPAGVELEWLRLAAALLAEPVSQAILKADGASLMEAAFNPDGQKVVVLSQGGAIRVWPADGKAAPLLLREADPARSFSVLSVAFSPDGKRVAAALRDGTIRVWPADGRGEPLVQKLKEPSPPYFVRFSPDGTRLFTISPTSVRVWSVDGRQDPLTLLEGAERFFASFSQDGKRVVIVSQYSAVRVASTDGAGAPVTFDTSREHPRSLVNNALVSPDGKRLAVIITGQVEIWPADGQGEPLILSPTLDGHGETVTFSPDGNLITAAENRAVRVWRTDVPSEPILLREHTEGITSVAFSPDGRQLLTGSFDKTARLWNLRERETVLVFRGHAPGSSIDVAFSPDGQKAMTVSIDDGVVRIWSVVRRANDSAPPALVADALERLRKATPVCLDAAQRQQHLGESPNDAEAKHTTCLSAR